MTEFQLGVVSKKEIKAIRPLSDIEYKEYKSAAGRMHAFLNEQQIYHFVRLNYEEYINLLNQYLEEYDRNPRALNMQSMFFNINRHIFNYLSSIRMFLDHNEYNLKKQHGADSSRFNRFKEARSHAYDTSFSYRFLYRLRNYAQHCGMPLGNLEFVAKESHTRAKGIDRFLSVRFDRDVLLSKFSKWGSQLRREIQQLPRYFDVTPHMSEAMKYIEQIYLTLIEDDLPPLFQAAEYIEQLMAPTKSMKGDPSILRIEKVGGSTRNLKVEISHMPLRLVKMLLDIKTRSDSSK